MVDLSSRQQLNIYKSLKIPSRGHQPCQPTIKYCTIKPSSILSFFYFYIKTHLYFKLLTVLKHLNDFILHISLQTSYEKVQIHIKHNNYQVYATKIFFSRPTGFLSGIQSEKRSRDNVVIHNTNLVLWNHNKYPRTIHPRISYLKHKCTKYIDAFVHIYRDDCTRNL